MPPLLWASANFNVKMCKIKSEIILRAPAHELLVVDAEEEADGEEGEEAAVEHLGHQDHHQAVNWVKEDIKR